MVMNDENKRHLQAIKIARETAKIKFGETFTETIFIQEDRY